MCKPELSAHFVQTNVGNFHWTQENVDEYFLKHWLNDKPISWPTFKSDEYF